MLRLGPKLDVCFTKSSHDEPRISGFCLTRSASGHRHATRLSLTARAAACCDESDDDDDNNDSCCCCCCCCLREKEEEEEEEGKDGIVEEQNAQLLKT
mmetsp:Transcript_10530/g.22292  ORF Transcript_10530/g.22292 Transcript_10530/m.22292 type:complete len:98 (+) Transcript_10530:1513-1806(+)